MGRQYAPFAVASLLIQSHLDVGVLVEELHALLHAPHVALKGAEDSLGGLGSGLLGLLLSVGDGSTDHLDDGNDEGSKGGSSGVVVEGVLDGLEDSSRGDG